MVVKADHERIKTLLKDTITLLCRNGLNFKTEFSVEALIGITLDKEDVVLVSINEIIRTELGTQLALAKDAEERNATMRSSDQDGSSESQPGTPLSTNGHQYRKRKHSSGHGSQREPLDDEQESDSADEDGRSFEKASAASPLVDESNSEPSNKRSLDDSNAPATRIKDDDTKDVIYIKEEIDTGDWPDGSHTQDSFTDPNIPAAGTSDQQHDDNFDFLHGGSLVPISSDSTMPQSWSDVAQSAPPGMNISPSKRSSTAVGTPTQGDQSQQITHYRYGMLPELVADMSSTSKPQRAGFQCPQCYKVLRTQQGLHYHIDLHRGIYRYKCTYCSKGFSSLTTYKGHVNVYHRERQEQMGAISSYSCPYDRCDKSYPYIQSLRNHISNAHRVGHAICLAYRPDEQQSAILERADPEAAGQVGDSGRSPTDPGSYCGMDLSIHPKPYGQVIFPTPEYVGSQTSAASHIQTCEAERRNEIEVKKLSLDEKL